LSSLFKNTAGQKWRVFAFTLATNEPVTGDAAQITAKISLDWGTATAITDTNPTEIEDGFYDFTLTQAETNAVYEAGIFPQSSTSGVQVIGVPAVKGIVPAGFSTLPTTSDVANAAAAATKTLMESAGSTIYTTAANVAGLTGASGGEGALTGTITIDDGAGNGLEGAVVQARRGGVLIASGTTDADGKITGWVLAEYTYDLAVRLAAGYQPKTDTLTVTADAWSKSISLTAIEFTTPADATLCTLQFRILLSNAPVSGAVCKARLLGTNQASDGTLLSNAESSDTTDASGVAELQLVQKGQIVKGSGIYRITVEIAGKPVASVETTIPNQSTCLFSDLLP